MYRILGVIALLVFLLSSVMLIKKEDGLRVWRVVFIDYPAEISLEKSDLTSVRYILQQTHKTILHKAPNGRYSSEILQSWKRNITYSAFTFCPQKNIKFSDGTVFDSSYLSTFLSAVLKDLKPHLGIKEGCVEVSFSEPSRGVLDLLSRVRNAPFVLSKEGFSLGLGGYDISTVSANEITLSRNVKSETGFDQIVIYPLEIGKSYFDRPGYIQDLNFVSKDLLPQWLSIEYSSRHVTLLQNVILFINHKDPTVRKAIFNCFDVQEFRSSFYPGYIFSDISGILPSGYPGANAGLVKQDCIRSNRKIDVKLVNWKDTNIGLLEKFSKSLKEKSNINLTLEMVKSVDIQNKITSREYELAVIALDSIDLDVRDFFKYFADPSKSFFSFVPELVKDKYSSFVLDLNSEELNSALLNSWMALPLFQHSKDYYYPKNISGFQSGVSELEIPQVDNLEVLSE